MRIDICESVAAWQRWRPVWDALAGDCAFRTWTWLATWWEHYGNADHRARRQLHVLLAIDDDTAGTPRLVGALPCYLQSRPVAGRVLRLLGDGEVCSDHLGLLVRTTDARTVAGNFANHLMADPDWDLLEFDAIDDDDQATAALAAALAERGGTVDRRRGPRCWSIALPSSWDEFLELQSKSHRKQLRRLETRVLATPQAQWRPVADETEFAQAWETLIDLHQRRRRTLGEPGCFANPRWAGFHRAVAAKLLSQGDLRLSWLELDGTPVAAEYHLARGKRLFAYQGGLAPEAADAEPGRLSMIACIQQAIAEGAQHFDLLRGDEPYKPHWRAAPTGTHRLVAAPPRLAPRLRFQARRAVRRAAQAAKQAARLFG